MISGFRLPDRAPRFDVSKFRSRSALLGSLLGAVVCFVALPACTFEEPRSPDDELLVVCTTGMISDLAERVAGENAEVVVLCGSGVDPHTYKATRKDMLRLLDADLVFYNGLGLEARLGDVLLKLASDGKRVVQVTRELEEESLLEPEEFAGHYDPHVWNDPAAWRSVVGVVSAELADLDASNADGYRARAQEVEEEILGVFEYASTCYASIPEAHRVLITSHDAFNYLGRAFGLEVLGIQGVSTDSQAGLADVKRLVDLIVDREVRAVFTETISSNKNMLALVEGCADRAWDVVVGGEVFSDAFGERGTYEGTYVGMVDHNATLITRALGGQAPEKGWRGRLSLPGDPVPGSQP